MNKSPLSRSLIEAIRAEFVPSWYGIHGISHWIRVRNNGLFLSRLTGANPDVIELFAFLHDSRRHDDGWDLAHGKRAADLVRILPRSLVALADQDLERLVFACEHHSHGLTEADVTVQTCWDADRLDLGRIGIKPEPRYLCTLAAKDEKVIELAFRQSQRAKHLWIRPERNAT